MKHTPQIKEFESWTISMELNEEAATYVHNSLTNNVVLPKGKRDSAYTGLVFIYGELAVWDAILLFLSENNYTQDFTEWLPPTST